MTATRHRKRGDERLARRMKWKQPTKFLIYHNRNENASIIHLTATPEISPENKQRNECTRFWVVNFRINRKSLATPMSYLIDEIDRCQWKDIFHNKSMQLIGLSFVWENLVRTIRANAKQKSMSILFRRRFNEYSSFDSRIHAQVHDV